MICQLMAREQTRHTFSVNKFEKYFPCSVLLKSNLRDFNELLHLDQKQQCLGGACTAVTHQLSRTAVTQPSHSTAQDQTAQQHELSAHMSSGDLARSTDTHTPCAAFLGVLPCTHSLTHSPSVSRKDLKMVRQCARFMMSSKLSTPTLTHKHTHTYIRTSYMSE